MLTDRELRLIREEQVRHMPDTVSIERRTNSDDGFGGRKETTYSVVASGIAARVTQAQTLDLGGQGGRKIEVEKWTIRMPYGTDCREHDRVVWDDIVIRVDEVKDRTNETAVSVAGERVK